MESNEFSLEDLTHFPLFEGIQASELEALLPCLDGYIRSYPRNRFLILDEDSVPYVGMLLSGMVFMLKEDENGHQSFLNYMLPGELFGESFSLRKKKTPSHVSFLAARNATALFLPLGKIMRSCRASLPLSPHHEREPVRAPRKEKCASHADARYPLKGYAPG